VQARRSVQVLINQVRRAGEGRAVHQQLQMVVDRYVSPGVQQPVRLELLGEVPMDPAVREAIIKRELLLVWQPGSPAAVALSAVATRMRGP
jgi:flagellar biosynthesis protein FlhG